MSDLHDDITGLSTDLNDKINVVKGFTNIIEPISTSGIRVGISNYNNSVLFTKNKDGSTHVECTHNDGLFGFGFKLSNNYIDFKNKKISIMIKSNYSEQIELKPIQYIRPDGWGGFSHKNNIPDPNTSDGTTSSVQYSKLFIDPYSTKKILSWSTTTDKFYDDDSFCIDFDVTTIGEFNLDIIIIDVTNNFILKEPDQTMRRVSDFIIKNDIFYKINPGTGYNNMTISSENKNKYIISSDLIKYVFKPFTIENTTDVSMWIYNTTYINITTLIGKNFNIYINIDRSNDTIDIDLLFKHVLIVNTNYTAWGSGVERQLLSNEYIINRTADNLNIEFNTKNIVSNIDSTKSYYLLISYEGVYNNTNDELIYHHDATATCRIDICDSDNNHIIANNLIDFNKSNYYTKTEIDSMLDNNKYITCWGDSLTQRPYWINKLQTLTGITVLNAGAGGESSTDIISRQGADAMVVNNITIPADTSEVLIATSGGIPTIEGHMCKPLLQSGQGTYTHFNPCKIGDVEGTLRWTGSGYTVAPDGTWVFKRNTAGDSSITINRPTILRTNYDMNRNNPYLMIIFIGQNGGWNNDLDTLVRQHRLMIEHANAKHVIILGLSSGSATSRADYETRMKQEFGRYFISLREYLSTPIYENGEIVSCYGIEDYIKYATDSDISSNIKPNNGNISNDTKSQIESGTVPLVLLADSVHFKDNTQYLIGDLIYKRCKELNIF